LEDLGAVERTEARTSLYRLLSLAFYPPKADSIDLWDRLNLASEGQKNTETSQPNQRALELEYNRLFVGPGKLPCPPYESVYRKDRPEMDIGLVLGPSVFDVKKRYAEAGLVVSGNFHDLPDHIAVELEYMCFLCVKELGPKTTEEGGSWRKMQRDFVGLHLKPWVKEFTSKVSASTTSPFYRLAASVLEEFIADETEYLDV